MRSRALPFALGTALFGCAAALDLALAAHVHSRPYDVLHLPTGGAARIAALGHRTFLSDLYWLSTVQYVGEPQAEKRGWDKLLPLVDLVTDLDPRHGYAYQTAGIVLSAAGRLDESNRILAKGMEKGPDWWSFPYYLAFNAWFYEGDYAAGARYAAIAARRPGASPNISHLALSLASKSGTPEDAIRMLRELRETVKDEVTASRLDEQLRLAILERDAQALERAAARFEQDHGRAILSLDELTWNGYVAVLPEDPFGGRYEWKPEERKVRSTANSFRFEVREPAHRPRFEFKPSQKDLERMPK